MKKINNRIHKGSLKLAGLYLAIIFAISLFFSATIYQLSVQEFDRGLRGPRGNVERMLPSNLRNDIAQEREELYNDAVERVLVRLIVTNIVILIVGGALSYYLALRTLRPIEEAQEAQNRFTADASHELRTPITAMMTENEVTLMDNKLTLADAKKQLSSNIEELQKLTDLSDGLMRLAGLENARLQLTLVSMNNIIASAIERMKQKSDKKHISISTSLSATEVRVRGDEQSLAEALIILIDNAIKYSPEKSKITVGLQHNTTTATITVADTGIGIKASDIPHLFDRFYRADTSRTKQTAHGYGLGLAIAKDIVIKHAGNITVTSTPGSGSVFTITLPMV